MVLFLIKKKKKKVLFSVPIKHIETIRESFTGYEIGAIAYKSNLTIWGIDWACLNISEDEFDWVY